MAFVACAACGTGDTKIDPGDLELRDLLGVSPEAAASWDSDQREAARRVLLDHLDDEPQTPSTIELVDAPTHEQQLARSLAKLDARRFADGDGALGLVTIADAQLRERRATNVASHANATADLQLSERWGQLDASAKTILAELAVDAGYRSGTLTVSPEPRLAVIAAYSDGHMVVNPVLLAAFDPDLVELPRTAAPSTTTSDEAPRKTKTAVAAGNPYSFYGSVAECAYAQRLRCESCLPNNNCNAVTASNGNDECNALAANDGRGYFLLCINLSLAITSVSECTADSAPGCSRDTDAASDLGQLEANANFISDSTCASSLDGCLAKIYGPPSNPFPGLVDGGVSPPPSTPPRDTEISCGDSCSDNNTNCDASPNCDCSGPSCNNSLSCDSTCSNSNTQSGCGGGCDSCSDNDTSSGGGGGGGCGGDSGGGSSGGDSGCGGCGGSSGGGGTSSGGSSGCSGGGGGGGCGGGGGGGGCSGGGDSGGGGCGGGGGGGGGCQVARRDPSPALAVALSLTWALLPIPLAAAIRRRSRRRVRGTSNGGEHPTSDDKAADKEVSL